MLETPFGEGPLEEVPLFPAPLETVIFQLRFPEVVSLAREDFIGPFQEAVRGTYPILRRRQQPQQRMTSPTEIEIRTVNTWEFADVAEDWMVGLATDSISVSTSAYGSRTDFLDRLRSILDALDGLVEPPVVQVYERLGVRYVNRLIEDDLEDISRLVKPEMVGALAVEMPEGKSVKAAATQAEYLLGDSSMQVRWGLVPPGATIGLGVDAITAPSWVLDMDVYYEGQTPYTRDQVLLSVSNAAERVHRYFRWAMTDEFIEMRRADR